VAELPGGALLFKQTIRSGFLVRDVSPLSYPFMKIVQCVGFRCVLGDCLRFEKTKNRNDV